MNSNSPVLTKLALCSLISITIYSQGSIASTAKFTAKATLSQVRTTAVSPNINKTAVIAARKKTLFGIDVLEEEKFSRIRRKNVGLLTNTSGIDHQGNSTAIVFAESKEFILKAVFFPEHDGMLAPQTLAHLRDKKIPTYCTHSDQTGRRTPEEAWLRGSTSW